MIRLTEQLTPKRQITFLIPDDIGLSIYRSGDTFEFRKTEPLVKETVEVVFQTPPTAVNCECIADAVNRMVKSTGRVVSKIGKVAKKK